jgi:hypothetical protein
MKAIAMRNMVLQNQVVFGTVNAGKDAFEVPRAAHRRAHRHQERAADRWLTAQRFVR